MLSREVTTLECVHHPYILRLFEVVETLGRVHLVTEWIRGGELYHRITQGGPLKETQASPLYKQLLLAVKHMHNLGFVHRDIKAENVLLVTEDRIKLADFGFSTQLMNGPWQHLDTFCGSPPYAAPELFSDDHYIGGPVDVWALGVLLYFMVIGNMPFRAPTVPALRAAVLKGDFTLTPYLSLPCIRLIQRILVHTPSRRPSIDQMLSSQWVAYNHIEHLTSKTKRIWRPSTKERANKKNNYASHHQQTNYQNHNNKERQSESLNHFTTIQCNTKRANSVMVENFLNPIDSQQNETDNNELNGQGENNKQQTTTHSRRSIFSGNMKKKIGPMETEKEKGKFFKRNSIEIKSNDISSIDSKKNSISSLETKQQLLQQQQQQQNNDHNNIDYDEEQGEFIMLPTVTHDLTHLHPMEIESRLILNNLGITPDMLCRSIPNGPRSDIIGAYRIVIHRIQKQALLAKQAEVALEEASRPKNNRTCAIL